MYIRKRKYNLKRNSKSIKQKSQNSKSKSAVIVQILNVFFICIYCVWAYVAGFFSFSCCDEVFKIILSTVNFFLFRQFQCNFSDFSEKTHPSFFVSYISRFDKKFNCLIYDDVWHLIGVLNPFLRRLKQVLLNAFQRIPNI